jgi:hypothetical protein
MEKAKIDALRRTITENLRVQKDNAQVEYIDVGNALIDVCSRWFGKGKESKNIITGIISRLQKMQEAEDARDEAVKQTLSMGTENSASAAAGTPKSGLDLNFGINKASKTQEQTELSF